MDLVIGELAERQHGVVARAQLEAAGVGRRAIGLRLERRRLLTVHRGVYAVGHPTLTREGRWMAAVLAVSSAHRRNGHSGEVAISHRSAAQMWELPVPQPPGVEVTASWRRAPPPGILLHRSRLPGDELTVVGEVPVTTVTRTILDLAATLRRRQVERAMNEAEVRGLGDARALAGLIERYPGRRGVRAARAIVAERELGLRRTRSELEARFLDLLSRADLPRPATNVAMRLGAVSLEADCVWRDSRLMVELDSHAFHTTYRDFERDRRRDRAATIAGWRVIRVTWRQLHDEPEPLLQDLRAILTPKSPFGPA